MRSTDQHLEQLITTEQAAEFLQISPATLVSWRRSKGPPPYHRIGRRIRYAPDDLRNFIDSTRVLADTDTDHFWRSQAGENHVSR